MIGRLHGVGRFGARDRFELGISKFVNTLKLSVCFPSNPGTSLSDAEVKSKNEFAAAELGWTMVVFLKFENLNILRKLAVSEPPRLVNS